MLSCVTASWAQPNPDGSYSADSYQKLMTCLQNATNNGIAKPTIRLTADIYLSDGSASSNEPMICETFMGTLEGQGHTIWAARPEVQHDGGGHYKRSYLFGETVGATVKNLTIKNLRVDSSTKYYLGILAPEASEHCVFEDVTFDHCSIWSDRENVGIVGQTYDCTFKNITVKGSDFTTDDKIIGAVAGEAHNCNFTGCVIDDNCCICADGATLSGYVGGVVGRAYNCTFNGCINSAFVAGNDEGIGGIVGIALNNLTINGCVNTGMIISLKQDDVPEMSEAYNDKTMPYTTRYYKGKYYVIRTLTSSQASQLRSDYRMGGIVGRIDGENNEHYEVSSCINFGTICSTETEYIGGIIGYVDNKTLTSVYKVSNCLADFKVCGNNATEAIVGNRHALAIPVNIEYCLSATTYDLTEYDDKIGDSMHDNYSLASFPNSSWGKRVTKSELGSGAIAMELGCGWEQNIGNDLTPVPTGLDNKLYHTRNVKNTYGTICLPFDVNSDDIMKFYTLANVSNGSDAVTISFNYVETLQAGHPALFSVAEQGDITLEPTDNDRDFLPTPYAFNEWNFIGTFEERVFEGEDAKDKYYISGDMIRNATKVTIAPCRAYFMGPIANPTRARTIQFEVTDEDGETTALEFAGEDLVPVQNAKTFTIMGTEASDGYRGIVIRGGKKLLIY